jgi:hypothetical protein
LRRVTLIKEEFKKRKKRQNVCKKGVFCVVVKITGLWDVLDINRTSAIVKMEIKIREKDVVVSLRWYQALLSLRRKIKIPLSQIKNISTKMPKVKWSIRAPGTAIPFYFYAGTFYTSLGREFWYKKQNKNALVIELKGKKPFKRIILAHYDAWHIAQKIQRKLSL